MMKVATVREPETFSEAAKDPQWIEAMNEEMQALWKKETWDLIPTSPRKKAIGPATKSIEDRPPDLCSPSAVEPYPGAAKSNQPSLYRAHKRNTEAWRWPHVNRMAQEDTQGSGRTHKGDNMSSIYLARNPVSHAWTKHIEVHYHSIRQCVLAGDVELQHISMNLQTADIFTKALGADNLWHFRTDLRLTILDVPSLRGSTQDTTQ